MEFGCCYSVLFSLSSSEPCCSILIVSCVIFDDVYSEYYFDGNFCGNDEAVITAYRLKLGYSSTPGILKIWKIKSFHTNLISHRLLMFCCFLYFYVRKQLLLSACLNFCNSVRPSICHTGGSVKSSATRITKSSLSAAWKILVMGVVKLFHKFVGGHPEQGC